MRYVIGHLARITDTVNTLLSIKHVILTEQIMPAALLVSKMVTRRLNVRDGTSDQYLHKCTLVPLESSTVHR